MLLNDFYSIRHMSSAAHDGIIKIDAALVLNKSHSIFEGHFPGQPIVPGVCMVQMMREIMQVHRSKKLVILSASQIKFLSMLIPEHHPEINAEIIYTELENRFEVVAKLYAGDIIIFKIKSKFSEDF